MSPFPRRMDDGARAGAFLDRDGTVIADTVHVSRVQDVRLLPDAGAAIARLNEADIPVIVITNQSGIARGYFGEGEYEVVRAEVDAMLASMNARIDASYHCPHHPDITGLCDCRKPGPALYELAAKEHAIDLSRSVFIGDRWRDVAAALRFGGRGVLLVSDATAADERERAGRDAETAPTLGSAVDMLLRSGWPRSE
ncbi:MAG: D-glycero-alpha-D-manno-heptose-1,7-bisphosphate 7-phosphatase [Gemmatimonadaceae bacterium]